MRADASTVATQNTTAATTVAANKASTGSQSVSQVAASKQSVASKQSTASVNKATASKQVTNTAVNNSPTNKNNTQPTTFFSRDDSDDEEMAIIEHVPNEGESRKKITLPIAKSMSGAALSETNSDGAETKDTEAPSIEGKATYDSAFAFIKEGPLPNANSIVNGHLIQWKFYSEDGSALLRIPVLIMAVALIVNTVLAYSLYNHLLSVQAVIISVYVCATAIVICILDGRFFFNLDPLSFRGKLRNGVVRNVNMLRYVWGRGVLYIWVGVLHFAQDWNLSDATIVRRMQFITSGGIVMLGVIAILVGVQAAYNLKKLRAYVTDESALWFDFNKQDHDGDGLLNPTEFAHFIWDLGLEFDDVYTLKAFNMIDKDRDRKITFEEFRVWWMKSSFQAAPRDKRANFENPYHRFD